LFTIQVGERIDQERKAIATLRDDAFETLLADCIDEFDSVLSAEVHRVVNCLGFRLLNDCSVRPHPPVISAMAVDRVAGMFTMRRHGVRPADPEPRLKAEGGQLARVRPSIRSIG
jgi:hypothetical protein